MRLEVKARVCPLGVPLALAAAGVAAVCASAQMHDYRYELQPAVDDLVGGHVRAGLAAAPAYGGSLVPRLPFALVAHALGGGALAVYRAGALACVLAVCALAWTLDRRLARAGRSGVERLALAATCLLPIVVLRCLTLGHPEEALGGALCAGAVLLALRDRPALAGAALGAAVATKPWALLAVGPVLVAAPGRRALVAAAAAGAAAAILAPFAIADAGHLAATQRGAGLAGVTFHPQQLFWPLHDVRTHEAAGVVYRGFSGPAWVARLSHPLIVLAALPLTALFALGRRRGAPAHDALALLALVLLVRCVLDPWNQPYYAIPCVLAVAAWEVTALRRAPVLAPAAAALTWLSFAGDRVAFADARFALAAGWMLALGAVLGARLLGQPASSATAARSAA